MGVRDGQNFSSHRQREWVIANGDPFGSDLLNVMVLRIRVGIAPWALFQCCAEGERVTVVSPLPRLRKPPAEVVELVEIAEGDANLAGLAAMTDRHLGAQREAELFL